MWGFLTEEYTLNHIGILYYGLGSMPSFRTLGSSGSDSSEEESDPELRIPKMKVPTANQKTAKPYQQHSLLWEVWCSKTKKVQGAVQALVAPAVFRKSFLRTPAEPPLTPLDTFTSHACVYLPIYQSMRRNISRFGRHGHASKL